MVWVDHAILAEVEGQIVDVWHVQCHLRYTWHCCQYSRTHLKRCLLHWLAWYTRVSRSNELFHKNIHNLSAFLDERRASRIVRPLSVHARTQESAIVTKQAIEKHYLSLALWITTSLCPYGKVCPLRLQILMSWRIFLSYNIIKFLEPASVWSPEFRTECLQCSWFLKDWTSALRSASLVLHVVIHGTLIVRLNATSSISRYASYWHIWVSSFLTCL